MNPFDLPGPAFLAFYIGLSALVLLALVYLRRSAETVPTPKLDLSDPYLIAYLRGGEPEALRVATVSLIDRGLLLPSGARIKRADNASTASVRRPIEKELIRKFLKAEEATSIYEDYGLRAACKPYAETLKNAGLLPSEGMETARMLRVAIACFILGGIAIAKILIALERGHTNIWFLVILMGVAIFFAIRLSFPRLTETGAAMMADLQDLYSGLKYRTLQAGGATIEAMMLAAVFGVGALPAAGFSFTQTLFPRATKNQGQGSCGTSAACGSCGSSCGSSCGGGGCGGGCGGCGG